MPNSPYLGETPSKSISRLLMYEHAYNLWRIGLKPGGGLVTLAGISTAEIGCIKNVLNFNQSNVDFVDSNASGLRLIEKAWPGVRTHNVDIIKFMLDAKDKTFSFVNLDFCGTLQPRRLAAVGLAAPKIQHGGIVYYTFFRGREKSEFIKRLGSHDGTIDDARRLAWYTDILGRELGAPFSLVFTALYTSAVTQNKKCPMGIIGFQKTTGSNKERDKLITDNIGLDLGITSEDDMKLACIKLHLRGLNSTQIGSVLNISPRKAAAWMAHETRGTYQQNTQRTNK